MDFRDSYSTATNAISIATDGVDDPDWQRHHEAMAQTYALLALAAAIKEGCEEIANQLAGQ